MILTPGKEGSRMRVLLVGGGGREHSLAWKLSQSPLLTKLYCAPGNPGIEEVAECVSIGVEEVERLYRFAIEQRIDYTVVGPEAPLVEGIVDRFSQAGLRVFGPNKRSAELEGSKVFAKFLLKKYEIPTARFEVFSSYDDARSWVSRVELPTVVKADGLAGGKGSMVCHSRRRALDALDICMREKRFGTAGERVIVEQFLSGEEASILALTDGETILILPSSQDHKAVYDGDEGPNTGGMGAYSPAPVITEELERSIEKNILIATIHAMRKEGRPFKGVLYAGIILTDDGPMVLEFNVRFGDPEAQPILMRLKSDLLPVLIAVTEGKLDQAGDLEWDPRPAVCVVMASAGYPGSYEKGREITGLDEVAKMENVVVFHAGTARKGGRILTAGGRVLGVTALGDDIQKAIELAYEAVSKIHFEGAHYRTDIGAKALKYIL